jgi:hypothetical protein
VNNRARPKEEQGFENGMALQMKLTRKHAARADGIDHVTQVD